MINIRVYQLRRYYIFYAIQFTFGYTGKNQQISSYGKCMGFPFDFPQYWKIQQNHPSYGRTWEISTHTFPQHRGFFPMRFSSYCILSHMEMDWLPHQFHIAQENVAKSNKWRKSGKLVSIPFEQCECFFPLDTNPLVYFIILEMHGFPHQFLIAREYATKSIILREPEKLVLILFPQNVYFFPIISTFHGLLCYMGSAWVCSQHREMQRNPSNWLSLVN